MEMQMDFQQQFLGPQLTVTNSSSVRDEEEEEYKRRNKENIPPFSSYSSSSASVLRLPHPRKPLQDITHNIRSSPSVAEARARLRLGVRSSSNKCSKKKAVAHLSSVGVALSEKRCHGHENGRPEKELQIAGAEVFPSCPKILLGLPLKPRSECK